VKDHVLGTIKKETGGFYFLLQHNLPHEMEVDLFSLYDSVITRRAEPKIFKHTPYYLLQQPASQ